MRFNETGVGAPHNFVQLPEFPKETRVAVVDVFSVLAKLGVLVLLDVPNAVREGSALCASDLLLLETPLWKLNLVGKEDTTSHGVDELELGLDGAEAFLCFGALREVLNNFNTEDVVRITLETLVSICRNFVLPVCLGDRRPDVVGVQTSISRSVIQPD